MKFLFMLLFVGCGSALLKDVEVKDTEALRNKAKADSVKCLIKNSQDKAFEW